VIIPDVVLIQLSSWGWAQGCSKHVEDSNKHIIEETVRQVGYLPEPISSYHAYNKSGVTTEYFVWNACNTLYCIFHIP